MYRRNLLLTAGTAITTGFAGCTSRTPTQPIELVARADGWSGVAPPAIEGKRNPTLPLDAGAEYELVWENGDGVTHDIRIVTADDESVLNSDDAREPGQTVSVTFTATDEMDAYYCTYHPDTMRGSIRLNE